ncbi:TetR/AcrR family transcriptional regulator [Kineothrix sp. MB12-C1]|uniref:TetR/AcrR family transcriptional regulator n=1 Tax=Kineothrix sp. MB12-C1 TaxID=3070215 RepID=UPI0027D2F3C6|nr:TetR/AcrR family transcriptional regulator [Kineothrix sp. MB12-C1]WMC93743.1 TetR/AcrR family transcriptional regulator [Kineothrix sp. MB12-C1]
MWGDFLSDIFDRLPEEKRERIINSALSAFGTNGYKKTSIADVAKAAAVSKPMIFTYFGSKAALYTFLAEYSIELVREEFRVHAHKLLTDDFFERILLSAEIKTAMLKRYPAILSFLTSMYYEQDMNVRPILEQRLKDTVPFREEQMMKGIDTSRFKEGIDLQNVMKLLSWVSSGLADEWRSKDIDAMDALLGEFNEVIEMLKNVLYKEEI